jgi:ABC-2 type transport system ATP-binding protein
MRIVMTRHRDVGSAGRANGGCLPNAEGYVGSVDSVTVDGLVKRFGAFEAVKGVSLSVAEGEIFGFLGPNGAGKTTTINMLCTLLRPTAGRAVVSGFDVTTAPTEVRRRIGLVFQDTTLDEYLTAEQNLLFHAYAYGVSRRERDERMRNLLELVGLWDRRRHKVQTFSGGMKRRLEIARGLLHRPHVLFLDEPTLGLDPQTRRSLWDHILELREREGLTIFLTTHYMDEAEHCDRIAIIDGGEIAALDTPDALKRRVGGDLVTLTTDDQAAAAAVLREQYQLAPDVRDGAISFHVANGEEFLPDFVRGFPRPLHSIGVHRPTLDDVFLHLTGRAIRDHEAGASDQLRQMMRFRGH